VPFITQSHKANKKLTIKDAISIQLVTGPPFCNGNIDLELSLKLLMQMFTAKFNQLNRFGGLKDFTRIKQK